MTDQQLEQVEHLMTGAKAYAESLGNAVTGVAAIVGLAAGAASRGALDKESEVETLAEAVAAFERDLLARLYPSYPSSRKLAARLGASHTMIANKLRRYRLPEIGTKNG